MHEFMTNGSDIEQGHIGRRVYENIQITVLVVIAMKHRPEYARILGMVRGNDSSNLISVNGKCIGRSHTEVL